MLNIIHGRAALELPGLLSYCLVDIRGFHACPFCHLVISDMHDTLDDL